MKTNKQFIDEIYEKYDEYTKEKIRQKQYNTRKFINIAAVVIVILSSVIVFSEKKIPEIKDEEVVNQTEQNDIELKTVGNFENFYKIMKDKKVENGEDRWLFNSTINAMPEATTSDVSKSETNKQIENVDESDIVKIEGQYIYYVVENKVMIIDAQNPENSNKISEISFENFNPIELYVKNNKLIVIGNEIETYRKTQKRSIMNSIIYDDSIASRIKSGMIIYDISNIEEPKEVRRVMIRGSYISSRMIENNIYIVVNENLYASSIKGYKLEELNEDDYKPKYQDTVISKDEKCIGYDKIYNLQGDDTSYLILAGLNIENAEEVDIKTFLGAGQYVYASENNMYIATNKYEYGRGFEIIGGETNILKFGLEDGKIVYKEDAVLEGQINNQFSMDENEKGYFRIATTTGDLWNVTEDTKNNLYVLNDKLEEVGKIEGFAPDEKIYSVRYVGDKAYVVTFKQTDPLFVIDLSNPANPQILGELKLPGYSTYLHPYDDTHIIGFGYETKEEGSRVTTDGLKMVMFDISDFTNPKVLFKVNIGDRSTSSELLYNHKALLYSKDKNIISFPLTSYINGKMNSKAIIYEIDLNQGFVEKGEITHESNNYRQTVERIVYVNNHYYTMSKKLIKVANMESLEIIKEIEL